MSYQVIARKYRPQRFADVVGQEHVTQTLTNAIQQSRIAHAYLFVGPRGTGKTTIARIFAKCLNSVGGPRVDFAEDDPRCQEISEGRSLDVLEIDGASNRGIEEIRALRETVKYSPATSRFKIYIIDEVHMLTKEAFNALLKTLEEPPEHVKFMFATTEPEKVLPTILSRCQRYDLRRIPVALIVEHLAQIATLERVKIDESALIAVARGSEGCMRDAESTLDQLISFCGSQIVENDVLSMFGLTGRAQVQSMASAILAGQAGTALRYLNDLARNGKDLGRLVADLLYHFRNLLLYNLSKGDLSLLELTESETSVLKEQATISAPEGLTRIMEILTECESRYRDTVSKKVLIEVALIKAIQAKDAISLDTVLQQLQQLRTGNPVTASTPVSEFRETPVSPTPWLAPKPAAVIAPSVQTPEPPSPRPEPSPESEPMSVPAPPVPASPPPTNLTLDELWVRIVEAVGRVSQFTRSYLMQAHPVSITEKILTIGFDPQNADHLDLVDNKKNRELIQKKLQELGLSEVQVKFIKSVAPTAPTQPPASIESPVSPVALPVVAPPRKADSPPPPPAPAPIAKSAATTTTAPPRTETQSASASIKSNKPAKPAMVQLNKEDFKNDPLIKQALEIFKGQIVEVLGPSGDVETKST